MRVRSPLMMPLWFRPSSQAGTKAARSESRTDALVPPAKRNVLDVPPAPPRRETKVVRGEAAPNAAIADLQTVSSKLSLDGEVPSEKVRLSIDLEHAWPGDLRVTLTGPNGESTVLWDRKPGVLPSLNGTFELSGLPVQPAAGEWSLTVEDVAARDTGVLRTWGLEIEGAVEPAENPDRDPMNHIEYLASSELQGRDSPSGGLDLAAKYIAERLEKYGLTAPNPSDPQGGYFQTFDMFRMVGDVADDHSKLEKPKFGADLFQDAYYLDDTLKPEDLELLKQKHEQISEQTGLLPSEIEDLDDLRRLSVADGTVQNVMGMLEGTGPNKDEVIVVMAHYDHVGVGRNGVHPGADDNASGTAAILSAIPDLVEKQKRGELDRSILFLWTAAEEKGLVGAKYFVDHPIPGIGLEEITGVVNVDMVGRWDDERLSVIDKTRGQPNYLREELEEANAQMEDPFDRINRDIDMYTNRQDGAMFSRAGEDVLFLFEGLSRPTGGGDLHDDYHQPTDTIDKIYRDNGGEKPRRVRDLMVNLLTNASTRAPTEQVDWK